MRMYVIFQGSLAWTGEGWTADKYRAAYYLWKKDANKIAKNIQGKNLEVCEVDTRELFSRRG
jgi:hypothetical protein